MASSSASRETYLALKAGLILLAFTLSRAASAWTREAVAEDVGCLLMVEIT
jgi:hypothetical protein